MNKVIKMSTRASPMSFPKIMVVYLTGLTTADDV